MLICLKSIPVCSRERNQLAEFYHHHQAIITPTTRPNHIHTRQRWTPQAIIVPTIARLDYSTVLSSAQLLPTEDLQSQSQIRLSHRAAFTHIQKQYRQLTSKLPWITLNTSKCSLIIPWSNRTVSTASTSIESSQCSWYPSKLAWKPVFMLTTGPTNISASSNAALLNQELSTFFLKMS